MDYKNLLEHSFAVEQEDGATAPESRLEYLSRNIFDFTTYDGSMDVLFARKAVEVCGAISAKTTFDYIKDQENYHWYLLMCNIPFFAERIEWGTSIRGAWWGAYPGKPIELASCGLWDGYQQLTDTLRFSDEEWAQFIQAIVEFATPEMTDPDAAKALSTR